MKKLQDMYRDDKPREKMLKKGAHALKKEELIAVILGSGIKGQDILELSKSITTLIDKIGIDRVTIDDLITLKGVGEVKALQILASIEFAKRYLEKSKPLIESAKDVWNLLYEYRDKKQEYLLSITIDGASRLIKKRVVTVGILNQSLVHPREVFVDAIVDRAAGIIIAHNHPSGELYPSRADMQVTDRLKDAGRILGIELLDHIIIAKSGWYSFSEEGAL